MKYNIALWFIVVTLIAAVSWGVTKADLYQNSGPLLLDAVVRVIKKRDTDIQNKMNELVAFANANGATITDLPSVSEQQILNSISNKLETLQEYPWMGAE